MPVADAPDRLYTAVQWGVDDDNTSSRVVSCISIPDLSVAAVLAHQVVSSGTKREMGIMTTTCIGPDERLHRRIGRQHEPNAYFRVADPVPGS